MSDQAIDATLQPSAPAPDGGLSSRVGVGMVVMGALSVCAKAMSLLAQLVLTARLTKVEWALGGLAISIAAFPAVLQNAGLSSVLVHRQRGFKVWSRGAASLGMLLGLVACLAIIGVGVVAASAYHSPDLVGLMVFVGVTVLVNSAGVVPSARLQIDLRYGTIAKIALLSNLSLNLCSASMALYGLGPYACVVPQLLGGIVNVSLLWRHSHAPLRFGIHPRIWKFLLADASAIIITNLMWAVANYGDNVIVSTFATKEQLGVYYFAYTLSFQIVQVIAGNSQPVLMSALAKLADDPPRQARAFLRGVRLLAALFFPFIAALAVFCPEALHLVYRDKWDDAIPIIRVLCLGMTLFLISMPTGALLSAQGRFRTTMHFSLVIAVEFLLVVGAGAYLGGVLGVAIAVALHHWISGTIGIWLGLRPGGLGLREIPGLYLPPGICCAVAILAAFGAKLALASAGAKLLVILPVGTIVLFGVYAIALRLAFPDLSGQVVQQFGDVAGKIRGRFARR